MQRERRRFPRVDFVGMLEYSGTEGVSSTEITDISEGGLRLITDAAEQPGERVWLRLKFNRTDEQVEMLGQIVWARQAAPYQAGIQFIEVTSEQQRVLHRALIPSTD